MGVADQGRSRPPGRFCQGEKTLNQGPISRLEGDLRRLSLGSTLHHAISRSLVSNSSLILVKMVVRCDKSRMTTDQTGDKATTFLRAKV
ncbi:hypothetical protein L1987_40999 [Smallanthus sonchifolius]|uniref:Uncharacterized protein n=1 Tax=Smallanthus sonchifolius TaxID=185202 RepID=A0ACB9GTY7_9ASTR|nr:hypothetical protein L1987_40999 [Smallanthus sonchifolius]